MLRPAKKLESTEIRARDGHIGKIDDLLFDERFWHVRYLVIDTGSWHTSKCVLLSPIAAIQAGTPAADDAVTVNLTRDEVRRSPSADTAIPVTRVYETQLHEHYRWPPYWIGVAGGFGLGGDVMPAPATVPAATNVERPLSEAADGRDQDVATDDPHLRSIREVRGHRIEATDGEIGHVEDFLIDPKTWQVRYLVVDTRKWWPGKKVLVAPLWLSGVSWTESKVSADLSRAAIKGSPEYHADQPLLRGYADELHRHYQRPPPDW